MTDIIPPSIPQPEESPFQETLRRHGPWVAILILIGLGVIVAGTIRQDSDASVKVRDTKVLEECLDLMAKNPVEARQKIEAHLPQMHGSPLRPWFEFLALRSQVIEAQRDWVEHHKDPSAVIAVLDAFIQGHLEHPEVTAFAWLNKATLLEDLGRFDESAKAYAQLGQFPNSVATRMSGEFAQPRSRNEREKLWQTHLEAIKP